MRKDMKVKDLMLPQSFVEFAKQTQPLNGSCGLDLIKKFDSFGNQLETELATVYIDTKSIEKETAELSLHFVNDGYYGIDDENIEMPGAISDIVCFDKIVCFGMSGDGAPFCFDFRENKNTPSIIWWDDTFWRKISNSFSEFLSLFGIFI
jgi:hypothetical protein